MINLLSNADFRTWTAANATVLGVSGSAISLTSGWIYDQQADSGTQPNVFISQEVNARGDLKEADYPRNYLKVLPSSAGTSLGVASFSRLTQRVVYNYNGTARDGVFSFWVKSPSTATVEIVTRVVRKYGTGGSPSATETLGEKRFRIGSVYRRVNVPFNFPDSRSRTFGTSNDDAIEVQIFFQAGTSVVTNGLGWIGEVDIAAAQLEFDQQLPTDFTAVPAATGAAPVTGSYDYNYFLFPGIVELPELSADPANAPTAKARLYCKDNGSGKAQLCVIFPTGSTHVLATEA